MFQRKLENSMTQAFVDAEPVNEDNYLYAASANDMTGLAPTVAHNEYEADSYEEVYPYLPPHSPAEGIHAEYRTHVTSQNTRDKTK